MFFILKCQNVFFLILKPELTKYTLKFISWGKKAKLFSPKHLPHYSIFFFLSKREKTNMIHSVNLFFLISYILSISPIFVEAFTFYQFIWSTFYTYYNMYAYLLSPVSLVRTSHSSVSFGLFTENHSCHRMSSLTVKVKGERKASNYRKEALH